MKRYPKRAQHRWGPRRKFTGPPRRWTGLTLNFGPGTEIASAAYWMAGDALFTFPSTPITFSYALDPVTPRPGVLTFTTDGATQIEEALAVGDVVVMIDSPGGTVDVFERATSGQNNEEAE